MVNVKDKTCQHDDCETQPTFNFPNEKKGLYCVKHKLDGMVDVKHKTCQHDDCETRPVFNFPNEKKGLYCVKHKLDGMVDVKHKTCQTPLCETLIFDKYKGYCFRCFIYTFPDEPITRNYKTKEKAVSDFIQTTFSGEKWICDKQTNGCSKRRPDLLLDLFTHVIIIEIDENQHTNYDCSCENRRLMELSQDVYHRPIVFIRFNPDDYIDKDMKKIPSCWSTNKRGITQVSKKQEKNWKFRLECLRIQVEYWIKNETDKTIEVIQLFYDSK